MGKIDRRHLALEEVRDWRDVLDQAARYVRWAALATILLWAVRAEDVDQGVRLLFAWASVFGFLAIARLGIMLFYWLLTRRAR